MCVCWVLSGGGYYSRGGQRKGRGGHMWPPTCLWPFIKPGGGGRERRANRYWHLVEQGEAHAACWLKQQPSCAASKRSQHADSVRGYANKLVSIAFHIAPAGLVRPCQLTTLSPPTHTAHQEWHVTTPPPHRYTGHAPASVKTGPTQSDSNQTESEAEHIGSVRVDEPAAAAQSTSGSYIYAIILEKSRKRRLKDAGFIWVMLGTVPICFPL